MELTITKKRAYGRLLGFVLVAASFIVGAANAGVVDFESPLPKDLKPVSQYAGTGVPAESIIARQYQALGVVFEGVALVHLSAGGALRGNLGIAGINANGEIDFRSPIAFSFVDPEDVFKPAVTDVVSVTTDLGKKNKEISITLNAYGIDGKLLDSTGYDGTESGLAGVTIETHSSAGIHAVVIEQYPDAEGVAFDRLTFGDPVPVTVNVSAIILPESFNRRFDDGSTGTMPVAVLGQSTFNVLEIDPATCLFAGMGVKFDGGRYLEHIEDVNLDGYPDLVLQMDNRGAGLDGNRQEGVFTGNLFDGIPFEASIDLKQ